jgi:hypothetical protein
MSHSVQPKKPVATTTAGLRGTKWNPDRLPADTKMSVHVLTTSDKASITGYLFRRGGETTVVCAMHPRELNVAQYLVPDLLNAGVAVWVQGSRSPGNDIKLEHETALIDLAAGQCFLRNVDRFGKSVLIGTSGGGPLAAFYCEQASLKVGERLTVTPGGRPVRLAETEMPLPDGLVFVSTHLGPGQLLLNCIDPSVRDERDPLQVDASLSAFDPKNGYAEPPHSSRYSAEFVRRYRIAQAERVKRIDAFALDCLERKARARKAAKESGARDAAWIAAFSSIFTVWRTDADPRCFDQSIDPSDRAYGTLWGADPYASNLGSVGFARICTPESWLSNWSAFHSNASMQRLAPLLRQPVLMIAYTGDNSVFPQEVDQMFGWIGGDDKERCDVHGNHHGQPIEPGKPNGQVIAADRIAEWLRQREFI